MTVHPSEGGPLEERLARLRDAVDAARVLGLEPEAAEARAIARRVARRAGFGGSAYVMALAGGTGVGKSSVLNALAGREVSEVRAVRPTTDAPVAWVAASARDELVPLLDWLKVASIVTHEHRGLADVAIIDLPDVDSVRHEHRAMVDTLLPRIDAVTWIVDPEKYDDARVHAYWRELAPHADRLRFVLNKADRLTEEERTAVADDLRARLVADGIPRPVIHVVSALTGDGIGRMRDELAAAAHAKVIIAAKLEADRAAAAERLGEAAGVDGDGELAPLLSPERRRRIGDEAVAGALGLVDPAGVGRQVRGAVLQRARLGGGSFVGRIIALVSAATGRQRRTADPRAYLAAWRTRGATGRVLNPVRAGLVEAASSLPPESRGRVLDRLGADTLEGELERALDRVTHEEAEEVEVPGSPLWPVIGALQVVAGAILLFGIAWVITLFVAGGSVPVATLDVLVIGPVPMPLVVLLIGALSSAVLGWLLGVHATWVGRRVAGRIGRRVAEAVRATVDRHAFAGLREVEDARAVVARAVDTADG